jgi:hypothetical protein
MRSGAWSIALVTTTVLAAPQPGEGEDVRGPAEAVPAAAPAPPAAKPDKPEFPPFAEVAEGYEKVVLRGEGEPLYTLYVKRKEHQLLAELNGSFDGQKIFIATSIAGGDVRTGWQWQEQYCYWTRHDKKLVLMEPQLRRRAAGEVGDEELAMSVRRTWNDRVITAVPIVAIGPGRGPVIDLDELLVQKASLFTSLQGDATLARIGNVKAFPQNVEVPVTIPVGDGEMTTLHYSISVIPRTDYAPRESDDRVGYFLTVYKDLTKMSPDGNNFVRYLNRWNLRKRDAGLALSPPVAPIVFYIEHTVPVRYRRYVRAGILEWNKAFEKCGILEAIEVRQQDARTGAFMDIDPEDVRYNFFRWITSETPFAMGPSRVNPETGEILDADIIFDDAMLKHYAMYYKRLIAAYGMDGLDPQAERFIEERPLWDPLAGYDHADPARDELRFDPAISESLRMDLLGEPRPETPSRLTSGVVQQQRCCTYAAGKAMQMVTAQLAMRLLAEPASAADPAPPGLLDGVPEDYLGMVISEIVMHEVGHTLGLRHNFKASAWLTIEDLRSRRGQANVASVMDYNPIDVPARPEQPRGDWVTPAIGPYDYWAIEFGYTLDDTRGAALMLQVANRDVQFATDEDTIGPDPLVNRFDLGAEPLDWAAARLELVRALREKLLDRGVGEGESWHMLRQAYEQLLAEQLGAVRVAGRYVGGVYVNRDHRADPGARDPLVPVEPDKQRRALGLLVANAFRDDAFDTRPEVLRKLASDKHRHWGNLGSADAAFSVHDRIAQVQAFALLYVLNPGTLGRVLDNELRSSLDDDAVTLPEVMDAVTGAIFSEMDAPPAGPFTNRRPMISSLRRNLQSEAVDRLIDLSLENGRWVPRPVRTLAVGHLWQLNATLEKLVARAADGQVDEYTLVHLSDLKERINRALNAVYVVE